LFTLWTTAVTSAHSPDNGRAAGHDYISQNSTRKRRIEQGIARVRGETETNHRLEQRKREGGKTVYVDPWAAI
jgi:hypothetical protein